MEMTGPEIICNSLQDAWDTYQAMCGSSAPSITITNLREARYIDPSAPGFGHDWGPWLRALYQEHECGGKIAACEATMTATKIGRRLLADGVVADSGFIFRLPVWFGPEERRIAEENGVVRVDRNVRWTGYFLLRETLKDAPWRTMLRRSRCRVCGLLDDGEVCARCASRGFYIVDEVLMHPDGTPFDEHAMDERGPRRVRPGSSRRWSEERDAEPRNGG